MATPLADFSFTQTLGTLTVTLSDTSTGTPTSWSWDFGDGSSLVTTQIPGPHTYAASGRYTVTLTVTNAEGNSSISREFNVNTSPNLPVSLKQLARGKLMGVNYDSEMLDTYIAQWQIYLQPLVTPEVLSGDVFNEDAYTPLANILIATLAAYSIYQDRMTAIMSGASSSSGASQSTGSTSSSSAGAVKKIETGPAVVEWYDDTDKVTNFFKTSSSGSFGSGSSPIDLMVRDICTFASRMNITLPMCPPLPKPAILFRIVGRENPRVNNTPDYSIQGINITF